MGFLSFMTFICFTVTLLQANSTDFVNEALLTKLLYFHQYHCGDAATCGSSEHVEPSEFLIPVPCCIPCSCLPSCAEQQNCCPFPVNGTLTVPTTKSRMDTIVHENEAKMPNNGLGSVRKDMKTWNRTGENKAELEMGVFGIENITEFSSRDSEVQKMIGIDSAKEKCTRPQAFYRPNIYLDSPAYMMVVTCPGGFKDKLIIAKCSAGMNGVELLDMIPVTSKLSGLTYQNKYCLICNEKFYTMVCRNCVQWRET